MTSEQALNNLMFTSRRSCETGCDSHFSKREAFNFYNDEKRIFIDNSLHVYSHGGIYKDQVAGVGPLQTDVQMLSNFLTFATFFLKKGSGAKTASTSHHICCQGLTKFR